MVKLNLLHILFLLAPYASSIPLWDTPKTLFDTRAHLVLYAAFTQAESPHYTHTLFANDLDWVKNGTQLYHMIFDPNLNIVMNASLIAINASSPTIAGTDDAKSVFVVYQKMDTLDSNKSAVLFIESNDAGVTWSKPISLGNANAGFRSYPNILYQRETGRIVVFYITMMLDWTFKITMTTRPKGSTVFSAERYIYNATSVADRLELDYTRDGKYGMNLHLHWSITSMQPFESNITYGCSRDNGISWAQPVIIFKDRTPRMFSMSGSHDLAIPAIVSSSFDFRRTFIRVSRNAGRSWDNEVPFMGVEMSDLAICGNSALNKTMLFVISASGYMNPHVVPFGYRDIYEDGDITMGESPFAEELHSRYDGEPLLKCYMESKDTVVLIVIDSRASSEGNCLRVNRGKFNISSESVATK